MEHPLTAPARTSDHVFMDITPAGMSDLQQANLRSEVGVRVAVKTKQIAEQQGEAALALLKAAAEISPGASPDGVGATIDVRG